MVPVFPGLPKEYRFSQAESRDAFFIAMYFCCIFYFGTFDFKAFFAPCKWMDSPICANGRKGRRRTLSVNAYGIASSPDGGAFLIRDTQKTSPPSGEVDLRSKDGEGYNFPHCLPVKKRRVVVARNTLPARSTVVGNSGCEGLQG